MEIKEGAIQRMGECHCGALEGHRCGRTRARISLGDPIPDDSEILPRADELRECCTVAEASEGIGTPSPPAEHNAELAEIEI
jgi:hypothetical protein